MDKDSDLKPAGSAFSIFSWIKGHKFLDCLTHLSAFDFIVNGDSIFYHDKSYYGLISQTPTEDFRERVRKNPFHGRATEIRWISIGEYKAAKVSVNLMCKFYTI